MQRKFMLDMGKNAEFALYFDDTHTNPNSNLCAVIYVVNPGALDSSQ
jgi:hypothetical protein